jgi:GDPmannose 4,6-dehydratase
MKKAKRALITGITGQDGSYLAEFLLDKGYEVWGAVRRSSSDYWERIDHIRHRVRFVHADLLDQVSLTSALRKAQPLEIYNLAAQSFVPTSWEQPVLTAEFTAIGVIRLLEAMRAGVPGGALLPGLQLGNVRQGAAGSADGKYGAPSPQSLWRGQG